MKFTATAIQGAYIVETHAHRDERGSFGRLFCAQEFGAVGLELPVSQISLARSTLAFTLRGLHYNAVPQQEAKLVRCVRGKVYEVALDLRPDSPTFRHWFGTVLCHTTMHAVYVPEGCAQGYLTLETDCDVLYQMNRPYRPGFERGVRWNDPTFGIKWPQAPVVINLRDANYADFD